MEDFLALLIPAFLLFLLIRLLAAPMKLIWKLLVNSGCGFLCLWLLNSMAGFTGLLFPVNAVTCLISGFLGIPGIMLLGLAQYYFR